MSTHLFILGDLFLYIFKICRGHCEEQYCDEIDNEVTPSSVNLQTTRIIPPSRPATSRPATTRPATSRPATSRPATSTEYIRSTTIISSRGTPAIPRCYPGTFFLVSFLQLFSFSLFTQALEILDVSVQLQLIHHKRFIHHPQMKGQQQDQQESQQFKLSHHKHDQQEPQQFKTNHHKHDQQELQQHELSLQQQNQQDQQFQQQNHQDVVLLLGIQDVRRQ